MGQGLHSPTFFLTTCLTQPYTAPLSFVQRAMVLRHSTRSGVLYLFVRLPDAQQAERLHTSKHTRTCTCAPAHTHTHTHTHTHAHTHTYTHIYTHTCTHIQTYAPTPAPGLWGLVLRQWPLWPYKSWHACYWRWVGVLCVCVCASIAPVAPVALQELACMLLEVGRCPHKT